MHRYVMSCKESCITEMLENVLCFLDLSDSGSLSCAGHILRMRWKRLFRTVFCIFCVPCLSNKQVQEVNYSKWQHISGLSEPGFFKAKMKPIFHNASLSPSLGRLKYISH